MEACTEACGQLCSQLLPRKGVVLFCSHLEIQTFPIGTHSPGYAESLLIEGLVFPKSEKFLF